MGDVVRQQITPHVCVCCDIVRIRPRTQPKHPDIAAQYSTHQPNQPPPHPTNASKMQHSASNTKHPRSVLRFVEEKRGSGSKHPDIAARTVSGRGVRWAQVMSDQSRQGKSGRGRAPTPVQTGQRGGGWATWLGRGSFRRRKAREIQGILIKITLTRTVIHTPQLPLVKQGKTQFRKK